MKKAKDYLYLSMLCIAPVLVFAAYPDAAKYEDAKPSESIRTTSADRQLTQIEIKRNLRQAILADEALKGHADKIEIITDQNAIILQGKVSSKAEKVKVENLARARAGRMKVYNRLTY